MSDYIQEDSDQEEFDLNQQPEQGEIIAPDDTVWEPPQDED